MNTKIRHVIEAILNQFYVDEMKQKLPWAYKTGWLKRDDRIIFGYTAWIYAYEGEPGTPDAKYHYRSIDFKGLTKLYRAKDTQQLVKVLEERVWSEVDELIKDHQAGVAE